VGCRRSCTFCQTARQGFQGNLSAGEIVNQYHSIPEREAVTNIVYMGMGEPLDNFDGAMASLGIFTDADGYALPPRRITLSTVGIHPQLQHFLEHPDSEGISLAVSLHSPFPEERRRIMPVENANPIEETLRLIRSGREDRARRVSFEYTMFAGVNDTPAHVDGIARLLNGLSVRINLIPFHELEGTQLRPTPPEEIDAFAERLRDKGFRTSVRHSRGQDINAACGMLWTRHVQERTA
jgi:23S rRNA (adenine2503-C2)-methyltransferase